MDDIKVSVIVPVYGVECFIERCVRSLLIQSLAEVEFIFVDDATPDQSMEIVERIAAGFPNRKVRIISHDRNRGLPAARNTGLAAARGTYIFHCDSDDYVEPEMLERMYNHAIWHDADIVWCDWFLSMRKSELFMPQPEFATTEEAVKAMLGGGMKFNVWNKLVRHSLYCEYNISFPAGCAMGEDLTMVKLFAVAGKIAYLPAAFYHYVKTNSNAYSRNYINRNLVQLQANVDELTQWLVARFGDRYVLELEFLKLEVKFPFLLMDDRNRFYSLWRQWYPEANKYIPVNKYISGRSRFIQLCAAHGCFAIITFYSFLLKKVYYGLLYK